MYLLSFLTTVFNQFLQLFILLSKIQFQISNPVLQLTRTGKKETKQRISKTNKSVSFVSFACHVSFCEFHESVLGCRIVPHHSNYNSSVIRDTLGIRKRVRQIEGKMKSEKESARSRSAHVPRNPCGGQNSRYLMAT